MGDRWFTRLRKPQGSATGKVVLAAVLLCGLFSFIALLVAGGRIPLQQVFGGRAVEALASEMPRGKIVSSAADLRRAVEDAGDGAIILLAPGRYPQIALANARKTGSITITSADRSRPASIGRLMIRNSSGLVIRDVELAADESAVPARLAPNRDDDDDAAGGADGNRPVQVARPAGRSLATRFPFMIVESERITLDRLYVHGPLNNLEAAHRISAMMLRASKQITVSNSRFVALWHGIAMLDLDGGVIRNNEFSNIRTDGVRGGDVSNLQIVGNVFTDFRPVQGDHPDGIQLWSTPKHVAMKNIVIRDNMVVRGKGLPTQGIFLRDVRNGRPFQNVEIRDNLVMGGLYNGIAVNGVDGGRIEDNEIINYPDRKHSWLRVDNSQGLEVRRNRASRFLITRSTAAESENRIDGGSQRDEAKRVARWLDAKSGRRRGDSGLQQALSGKSGP